MQATDVGEMERREPLAPAVEPPAAPAPEKSQDSPAAATQDSCCAVPASRTGRWRPWLIGGAVVVPIGLYGGWDWLVAAGLAPILIGVLPCLAMCALGLCMGRRKPSEEMTLSDVRKTYETGSTELPKRG